MTIGEKIKMAREAKGLTQDQLGAMCGTTKQTIFKYENGLITNIPLDRLEKMAGILSVTPVSLMGWEDTARLDGAKRALRNIVAHHPSMPSGERLVFICEAAGYSDEEIKSVFFNEISPWFGEDFDNWLRVFKLPVRYLVDEVLNILHMTPEDLLNEEELPYYKSEDYDGGISFPPYLDVESGESYEWTEPEYPGATRLDQMSLVPLVGRIACGTPILAEENIEDLVDLPKHIDADFALECRGDSMTGAGIQDGDVVYIREQEEVENGQIAAVLVGDDEATLKRFYFDGTAVQLVAENPKYAPMVFVGEDINKVRVIGRAVAFTHSLI